MVKKPGMQTPIRQVYTVMTVFFRFPIAPFRCHWLAGALICALPVSGGVMAADSASDSPAGFEPDVVRERILDIQSAAGVYDPALIEAYTDLAARYAEQDDHEQAAQLYADALQVSRINDGPYNERQLRIIERLVASYEALDDTGQADTYHYLLFHTRSRLHESGSPARIDAVLDWGAWKLQRSTGEEGGMHPASLPRDELEELRSLYQESLASLDDRQPADNAEQDARYAALLYGQALTEIGLAGSVLRQPLHTFSPATSRYVTRQVCRNVVGQDGSSERLCSTYQVENPNYRSAQYNERNLHVDRARRQAQGTVDSLQRWHADHGDTGQVDAPRIAALEQALQQLDRASRRQLMRAW